MDIILSKFYEFLVQNVPKMVVKIPSQAKLYETIESKQAGDLYVSAKEGTDSVYNYEEFTPELMQLAGYNLEEIKAYNDSGKNPDLFENDSRLKTLLKLEREKYIKEYEDKNDYYRMLRGLPGYEDDEEIWFDDFDIYDKYGIEPCPVHEISQTILNAMETRGELEDLKTSHPDAKYLNHLGCRRIDIDVARKNDAFALLYFPNSGDNYSFYRDFVTYYESCREYFLTVIYNQYFNSKYDHYDGFIGFMILTMTINKIIAGNFKAFIERDFYDSLSTSIFLNAYGLYYDDRFTLSQTKLIAKNLNILLMNKATDVALLDVLDLLGFHDYTLMKYYLLKSHKMDSSGNPIFPNKVITDEEGNQITVPDVGNMYNYKFVRVPVKTGNLQDSLNNNENILSYSSVTYDDPYWIDDKELLDKLHNMSFNYIDTKYMDLIIIYRMYAIMFEISYFTRIILDRKNETQHILVSMAKISLSEIPIYDVMILLICLTCKFYKFSPVILKSPNKILRILGFNFEADIDAIRSDIENNPRLYSQELLTYLDNGILVNANDINALYANIKKFDRKLISLMNTARDLKSYRAYKKLYETLMYIKNNPELYSIDNEGTVPDTYTDYLRYKNPDLYKLLSSTEGEDACSELINYMTSRLTAIFTNTKYLKYIQIVDNSLIDSILKVLCFFKSYTVHMKGAGIVLLFDSRIYNMAHLYHDFKCEGKMEMLDILSSGDFRYWDTVRQLSESITLTEENATADEIMKSMADMQRRIEMYVTCKTRMQDVGFVINDKSSLDLLFEIPTGIHTNQILDPMTINISTCEYALTNFDPKIILHEYDNQTMNVNNKIYDFMLKNHHELVEWATEFANMKLNTEDNKERFLSKVIIAMFVKMPVKLFETANMKLTDKIYSKHEIVQYFYDYEETMDIVYINAAVEAFMTTMIKKLHTHVKHTIEISHIDMTAIQEYYVKSSLGFLVDYNLIDDKVVHPYDSLKDQVSTLVNKHLIKLVHDLRGNMNDYIRVKYRLSEVPYGKETLVRKLPVNLSDSIKVTSPYGTDNHFYFTKKDKVSFNKEKLEFIWAE